MTDPAHAIPDANEGPASWEKQPADPEAFARVLREGVDAIEAAGIRYVLIGGIASAVIGRPRWTQDIDLFVQPIDADRTLEVLAEAGFDTQKTNPHWLYKAVKDGVLIDVIFRVVGDIYLDDELLERSEVRTFKGHEIRVVSPEDLIVIKAAVTSEEVPHHWHDALGILASSEEIDWDYLLRRARNSARRVLSLLIYAESNDLVVPSDVIRRLTDRIYGPEEERDG